LENRSRHAGAEASSIGTLAVFGVVLVPLSLVEFGHAERWAKKTGRLKRQGWGPPRTPSPAAVGRRPRACRRLAGYRVCLC
jgi:hypothetical protein